MPQTLAYKTKNVKKLSYCISDLTMLNFADLGWSKRFLFFRRRKARRVETYTSDEATN